MSAEKLKSGLVSGYPREFHARKMLGFAQEFNAQLELDAGLILDQRSPVRPRRSPRPPRSWLKTWSPIGGPLTEVNRYSDLAGSQLVARSTMAYDGRGRMTDLVHRDALDAVFANYDYFYDLAGRLTSESHHGETSIYSYDPTGQLIGADNSIFSDEAFAYDLNGNPIGPGYIIGPNNQILSDGTYDYAYDAEGNTIRKTEIATGNVTEFTWDHRNRLVRVTERSAGGIILKARAPRQAAPRPRELGAGLARG